MSRISSSSAGRGAEFVDLLRESVLVADGAMGTMLYQGGVFINRCFDLLSVERPDLVSRIHREYVAAGARLLETNTFGANRARLAGHGLEDRLEEINHAAVRLAREAAGDRAFVGGSMGTVGLSEQVAGGYGSEDLEAVFREQAEALLTAGVDVFVVETIPTLSEMEAALTAIRGLTRDVPVVALVTFNDDGETQAGETPERVAERLTELGADVIGANCSVGPKPMLDCLVRMARVTAVPLAAMPNAGLPQSVAGRLIYMAAPDYFGKFAKRFVQAGVRLLGGCCGTTPEHVRQMAHSVSGFAPARQTTRIDVAAPAAERSGREGTPTERKTALAGRLAAGAGFAASIELTPPKSADLTELLEAVRRLHDAGVQAVNIPEYARISPRPTPISIARRIRDEVPIETIVHYCCRDRNLYGMQADLLSAHALDVRDILIITGDPPKAGEYAVPTAVFDVDSVGLVSVAAGLNRGLDAAGRETDVPLALHVGVGVNPGAVDLDREVERFRRKVEAGAEFAMSQPVFDPGLLERFTAALGRPPIPILVGILPLYSYRNAEFLHNEVPGMQIPAEVRERMLGAATAEAGRAEGVAIAREALDGVRGMPGVAGVYVMPPFGRYHLALDVLAGSL